MRVKTPFSEKLETGNKVAVDQTKTIRVYHATKKVRGNLLSQCQGGCGAYLSDEEKLTHKCDPANQPNRTLSKWRKRAIHKATRQLNKKLGATS